MCGKVAAWEDTPLWELPMRAAVVCRTWPSELCSDRSGKTRLNEGSGILPVHSPSIDPRKTPISEHKEDVIKDEGIFDNPRRTL